MRSSQSLKLPSFELPPVAMAMSALGKPGTMGPSPQTFRIIMPGRSVRLFERKFDSRFVLTESHGYRSEQHKTKHQHYKGALPLRRPKHCQSRKYYKRCSRRWFDVSGSRETSQVLQFNHSFLISQCHSQTSGPPK